MFSDERRLKTLKLLEEKGRVLAKDLAVSYNVSIDSIRRDLTIMEKEGLLKRTHGGAISLPNVRQIPQKPSLRYGEGSAHQNSIAKLASSYIKENHTVFIGGASIHYILLQHLPTQFPFTVITNSLETAYYLRKLGHIKTYLIGGEIKKSGNITDALAIDFVKQFTVDLSFATAGGLSSKGLSTTTPEVSIFHKTIYDNSNKIIALIEHNKFGVNMFSHMYPLNKISVIITDEETTQEHIDLITREGIEVRIANQS